MLFNLTSISDWHVSTTRKQWKVDIDNACENTRRVRHDYTVGDLVYEDKSGIYCNIYHKNYGLYIITEVFPKIMV